MRARYRGHYLVNFKRSIRHCRFNELISPDNPLLPTLRGLRKKIEKMDRQIEVLDDEGRKLMVERK